MKGRIDWGMRAEGTLTTSHDKRLWLAASKWKTKMSRLGPIETIEELRQLLFDVPGDTAVEIEVGIAIIATTALELYRATWQGPVAVVFDHDPDRQCISLVRVERP